MSVELTDLPDFPALKQVQDALWSQGEARGAAVMIGAGFSQNARLASSTGRRPPLWSTFEREMAERLYPGADGRHDPLKLADEYKAALGQHALDALIRRLVPDDQWTPGDIHERLLSLPWADVLTTNWDTLLERTELPNPDRSYEIVRTIADIARTRAPRIVKLHGSLPSHTPFIFTEEDFRRYPHRFAPFVNLAQQVLLENELCLVGFSGDDPNFLQWSGWVRDQLGESARRIRLVGALNLSPSKRQVLEAHNVSPIDLAPLVNEGDPKTAHSRATEIFLQALWDAKPAPTHEWRRVPVDRIPPADAKPAEIVKILTVAWRRDRAAYPGWIVAPASVRERFRYETDTWWSEFHAGLNECDEVDRAAAFSELGWRYEVSLWPLDTFARGGITAALDAFTVHLDAADRVRLIAQLLADARRRRDWMAFDQWVVRLEAETAHESRALAVYQRALRAWETLDLESLAALVPELDGDDPIWMLRRAGLLAVLREDEKATETLRIVRAELKRRRSKERGSIWLLSREAWAAYLWRATRFIRREEPATDEDDDAWPVKYRAAEADPWDQLRHIDDACEKQFQQRLKDAVTVRLRFDAGASRRTSGGTRWVSHTQVSAFDEFVQLVEVVGLPPRLGMTGISVGRMARAIELHPERGDVQVWRAAISLPSHSEGLIDQVFSRVKVACLPENQILQLSIQLRAAIDFATTRMASSGGFDWVEDTRRYTELLSRLMVRHTPESARAYFAWALTLGQNAHWDHWWLFEPLGSLLLRSLEAIPPEDRADLAIEAIRFPLPGERSMRGDEGDWPELMSAFATTDFASRDTTTLWSNRISELIDAATSPSRLTRTRAIIRCLRLHEAGVLTTIESARLAEAVWIRRVEDSGLPSDNDLYPFVFLVLPEPSDVSRADIFDRTVVQPLVRGELSVVGLSSIQWASAHIETSPYVMSVPDAVATFDVCMAWRPRQSEGSLDLGWRGDAETDQAIGSCLAWGILPQLAVGTLNAGQGEAWLARIESGQMPALVQTAHQIVRLFPETYPRAVAAVRRGLASRNDEAATFAIWAVHRFVTAHEAGDGDVPEVLRSDIATLCAYRRDPVLSHALWCARHLLNAGLFSAEEQRQVTEGIGFLLVELRYEDWDETDPRTRSLSLIRAQCALLAEALLAAGVEDPAIHAWIAERSADPFPEVRFAKPEAS